MSFYEVCSAKLGLAALQNSGCNWRYANGNSGSMQLLMSGSIALNGMVPFNSLRGWVHIT